MKTIAEIPTPLLLEQVAPIEQPVRLGFGIIDPVAFSAWCAERGMTVEEYDAYLANLLTPRSLD